MFHKITKDTSVILHFVSDIISHGDIIMSKIINYDNLVETDDQVTFNSKFKHCFDLVSISC